MLKLRKNKKGFTLVELIVVIAIMAVLAGTVAGVTVSQLNKQTDKTMASEAKGIADFISTKIMEESYDFTDDTSLELFLKKKGDVFEIDNTMGIGKALTDQYGDKIALNGNGVKGKTIGVKYADKVFTVSYTGKQSSGGNATYTVNEEGVVSKPGETETPVDTKPDSGKQEGQSGGKVTQ